MCLRTSSESSNSVKPATLARPPVGAGAVDHIKMSDLPAPTAVRAKVAGFDSVRRLAGRCASTSAICPRRHTAVQDEMTVLEYLPVRGSHAVGMAPDRSQKRIKEIGGRAAACTKWRGKLVGEAVTRLPPAARDWRKLCWTTRIFSSWTSPPADLNPKPNCRDSPAHQEVGKEKTVILSTTILPEVQATCSRMLNHQQRQAGGRGTADELRARERPAATACWSRPTERRRRAVKARLDSIKRVSRCESGRGEAGAHAFSFGPAVG